MNRERQLAEKYVFLEEGIGDPGYQDSIVLGANLFQQAGSMNEESPRMNGRGVSTDNIILKKMPKYPCLSC